MKRYFVFVAIVLININLIAQKIKIVTGGVENLIGVNEYNIVFDYSNITIAKFDSEEAFLKEKMQLREEYVKGSGEKFKHDWFSFRDSLYEPRFITAFNDYFSLKRKIKIQENSDAKYTMLISTVFVYPGYNVGVWYEDSKLKATITIYETNVPENIIFTTKEIYVKGKANYHSGKRISNAYGMLARRIAAYLRRKTF